jgi:putative endonuclease
MYFVYILKSENHFKSYVGHTDNIDRRLKEHNDGKSIYTKMYKPWKLIYKEEFNNINDAIKREKYYKSHSGRIKLKRIFQSCRIV